MTEEKPSQIYGLLSKVMREVGSVGKNRDNQQQRYKFRGIDDIYFAVHPALVANGVFVVPEVLEHSREDRQTRDGKGTLIYTIMKVKHTFWAPDGSSVEAVTIGEAMDSGDKSANKAMSAAMKYALIETLAIPTDEPIDTENETHEVAGKGKPVASKPSPSAEVVNKQNGEVAELASPEQIKEMKSLVGHVPDELSEKWFAKAGKLAGRNGPIESWDEMQADYIAKCIQYTRSKLIAKQSPKNQKASAA